MRTNRLVCQYTIKYLSRLFSGVAIKHDTILSVLLQRERIMKQIVFVVDCFRWIVIV